LVFILCAAFHRPAAHPLLVVTQVQVAAATQALAAHRYKAQSEEKNQRQRKGNTQRCT